MVLFSFLKEVLHLFKGSNLKGLTKLDLFIYLLKNLDISPSVIVLSILNCLSVFGYTII